MSEEKNAKISQAELLMFAETVGHIQHELQWIIELVRTKAADMGVYIDESKTNDQN